MSARRVAYADVLAALERNANGDLPYTFRTNVHGRELRDEAWATCPLCGDRLKINDVGGEAHFDCKGSGCSAGLIVPELRLNGASLNGSAAAASPRAHELAELFAQPGKLRANLPPEPDFVLEGYIARGAVHVWAGKPKVGKSTLACAAAVAVSSPACAEFLDRGVATGPVAYVSEEAAVTAVAKLPDEGVWLLTREAAWPRPPWADVVHAAVKVSRREGAVLLVIDTFPYWAALPPEAEKDAGAVTEAMGELVGAARDGLAVLLVHHSRKAGGDEGDALRGSGAFAGVADAILEVERPRDEGPPNQRQLVALARWSSCPGLLLVDRDHATGAWRKVGEGDSRDDAADLTWRERLLEAVPADGYGITFTELERVLGHAKQVWRSRLDALVAEGTVLRGGDGKKGSPFRHHQRHQDSGIPEEAPIPESGNGVEAFRSEMPSHPLRGCGTPPETLPDSGADSENGSSGNGEPPPPPPEQRPGGDEDWDPEEADATVARWLRLVPGSYLAPEDPGPCDRREVA
jgi:hypothetical protein